MRFRTLSVSAVLMVPMFIWAQKQKEDEPSLPAIFGAAHNVYVQPANPREHGQSWPYRHPGDLPEVRDTENAIRDWGRYELAPDRDHADLVIIVGKAPPDSLMTSDSLTVCAMDHGRLSPPIWRKTMNDGLQGPRVPLLDMLKGEVERQYPLQRKNDSQQ